MSNSETRAAGYEHLIARYGLEVIPNWHRSCVSTTGPHRVELTLGVTEETYQAVYWPGESLGDHLEFALKYDGTNIGILASLFAVAPQEEVLTYLKSKPTGKYARRLWFLYEFLTEVTLPLDDLKKGNYVELLDSDRYYTVTPARQVRRQRVNDNLLGDHRFCPTIRRTDCLLEFEKADLTERCQQVVAEYSPELLKRVLSYLYTKETKSSFEIEHLKPDSTRTERFVSLLQLAEKEDFCDKSHLIDLQNRIVDPRFREDDYRENQNYVGESVAWQQEKIHFVSPRPEELPSLMDGLLASHSRMSVGEVAPVVHATAVSYGFVFLHPFEDGNGRIHRFLIHNILARQGFTPQGIMFPISASILKQTTAYDDSLESFSKPLTGLIEYSLDEQGRMTVHNDRSHWYAFIDMTSQVEAVYRFIQQTIETELVEELSFLAKYDETKRALQEIVDMPDRQIDLFIRFCLQNGGQLSSRKRSSQFEFLTDDELGHMEQAIHDAYGGAT